jgi:hypothetical protein
LWERGGAGKEGRKRREGKGGKGKEGRERKGPFIYFLSCPFLLVFLD